MGKNWRQSAYHLKKWRPVFDNKYVERRYKSEHYPGNAFSVARGILVFSIFYSLLLISDIFIEFSSPEARFLNTALKLFVGLVGLFIYLYLIKNPKPEVVNKVVLMFVLFFTLALFLTFTIYSSLMVPPASLFELALCCAFLTVLTFIFVPLSFFQQCVSSAAMIILYTTTVVVLYSIDDSRFGVSTSFMLLANVIGLSISYTINKNFRIAWTFQQEKDRDNQLLKIEIKQREKLEHQLKRLAMTDALTGIDNRRSFMEHLSREKKRSDRQYTSLSIITFDIDLFKHINDQFGHDVGDKVLMEMSSLVQDRLRETDIFGRIGGEEFAILMPDSSKLEAIKLANSLREAMADHAIVHDRKAIKVTASFGIAEYETNEAVDILLRRADKAMYDAKNSGRNCVSDKSEEN